MATLEKMYPGIAFSPQATLTKPINEADTIIYLSSTAGLPDGPNLLTIGIDETAETIIYAVKLADSVSGCTRGVEGTAKKWQAGELAGRNFTNKDFAALLANIEKLNQSKQEAEPGKGLSVNDFSDTEKKKLDDTAKSLETVMQNARNQAEEIDALKQANANIQKAIQSIEEVNTQQGEDITSAKNKNTEQDTKIDNLENEKASKEELTKSQPRKVSITLPAGGWSGTGPWQKAVTDSTITSAVTANTLASITYLEGQHKEALAAAGVTEIYFETGPETLTAVALGAMPAAEFTAELVLQQVREDGGM